MEPHVDYRVKPQWITNLVSAKKMSVPSARQEYVACVQSMKGNLANLEVARQEKEGTLANEKLRVIATVIEGDRRPFLRLEKVEKEFPPQYDRVQDRYKFLVICGPSQTGNTCYARQLCGDRSRTLEVNCAGGAEPDLRQLDVWEHEAILFDEAAPALVLQHKKLFQAPACWLDLGTPSTNCHVYRVMVSGIKMIVASNTWAEDLAALEPEGDREWPETNSVFVPV